MSNSIQTSNSINTTLSGVSNLQTVSAPLSLSQHNYVTRNGEQVPNIQELNKYLISNAPPVIAPPEDPTTQAINDIENFFSNIYQLLQKLSHKLVSFKNLKDYLQSNSDVIFPNELQKVEQIYVAVHAGYTRYYNQFIQAKEIYEKQVKQFQPLMDKRSDVLNETSIQNVFEENPDLLWYFVHETKQLSDRIYSTSINSLNSLHQELQELLKGLQSETQKKFG